MIFRIVIVVPTLNASNLLPRLLNSLSQQTWAHWRILFIDGHSRLEQLQLLERLCANEPRCSFLMQAQDEHGIFGAMNQGFSCAGSADWVLFWGSDDWAADSSVLYQAAAALEAAMLKEQVPDLLVCRGRYVDATSGSLARAAVFQSPGLRDAAAYRRALFLGFTPPHQATLFGPGARQRLDSYAADFCLSADLDYFLQLSRYSGLRVQCLDLELVHMSDGGVSGRQTKRRLQEVRRAYRCAFGWRWWFPFFMRYVRRAASLLNMSR